MLPTGLLQVVASPLMISCNLMKVIRLLQLIDKLQEASKIDNLQQGCCGFDCVQLCDSENCFLFRL